MDADLRVQHRSAPPVGGLVTDVRAFAILPDALHARLRAIAPPAASVTRVRPYDLESLRCGLVGASILADPHALGRTAFDDVIREVRGAGAKLILYGAPISQLFAERYLAAAGSVSTEAVLAGYGNERAVIARLLEWPGQASIPARVCAGLKGELSVLQSGLRERIVGAFAWAAPPTAPSALFDGLVVSPHAARRWLREAGLARAATIIAASHTAHLFELRRPGISLHAAWQGAIGGRDASIERIEYTVRAVIGLPAAAAMRTLGADDVTIAILRALRKRSGGRSKQASLREPALE